MPSRRRLLLLCISVAASLLLLEGAFRLVRLVVRGPHSRPTVEDAELGWVHNVRRPRVDRLNSCGEAVATLPAPTPYFIRTPRTRSGTRVLFLGDSTTHAHEVSTGSAYYDTVELLGQGRWSVWAAGAGGYGNLQESLLLERVFDEVMPDIVVWQLDANDISNNVYRLDFGVLNNNVLARPYLEPASGLVERRPPGLLLFRISEAAQFALSRFIVLDQRFGLGVIDRVEGWLGPPPAEFPMLEAKGLKVLDRVVADAIRRHPATRFAGFSVSDDTDAAYGEIFRRHGAIYWPGIGARVSSSGEKTDCAPRDSHWNHTGNRIAGQILSTLLSEL